MYSTLNRSPARTYEAPKTGTDSTFAWHACTFPSFSPLVTYRYKGGSADLRISGYGFIKVLYSLVHCKHVKQHHQWDLTSKGYASPEPAQSARGKLVEGTPLYFMAFPADVENDEVLEREKNF